MLVRRLPGMEQMQTAAPFERPRPDIDRKMRRAVSFPDVRGGMAQRCPASPAERCPPHRQASARLEHRHDMKASGITDFTKGGITRHLMAFSAPLFFSNLLQIVYNLTDMIIVGQALGKVGLSAVSVGGDVAHFLTFLSMGFAGAGQVIIAQYIGAGAREKLIRFIGTMLSFLLLCSVFMSSVCLLFRAGMLELMHTPAEAFSEALAYSTVTMCGLVFIYGYNALSAVLRGMGDSVRPFLFVSAAVFLNIALDLAFVAWLGMGSAGAAAATVISQGFSFLLCAAYIVRYRSRYALDSARLRDFRIDGEMLADLVKLGVPMAIKTASIQLSKMAVNSWINSYGVAVSAFAGIANKVVSTSILASGAFSTAGATMVGQNIGARKYERASATVRAVYRITMSAALLLSALLWLFPEAIFRCFTDDPEVMAVGLGYVPIGVLVFIGSAARSGMNALINGSGSYAMNFVNAILDGIVMRLGLAFFFGLGLGMRHMGFWLGDAVAGFTPFVVGMIFWMSGSWKKARRAG